MTLDRITPPAIHQATEFTYELPAIEKHTIGENLSLYSLNAGTQPVISFEIYIPKVIKTANDVAVAKAVTSLLKAGTTSKTALQINEAIEQVGATLAVNQDNDYFTIKLQCLTKHFTNLLPLVFEIIADAQFPGDELEIYRQQAIQLMTINLKKSEFVANRTIDELVYGFDHPYGSYSVLADYETLTRAAIIDYYSQNISLTEATFFVSGQFETGVIDLIKKQLVAIHQKTDKAVSEIIFTEKPNLEKKHRITNDEKAHQGAIRIAQKFIPRDHPDFTPMLFVNTLFGGYFGSRLMSNIREEKGYTYGIYSYVQQNKKSNSYAIATDVGRDVAEAAVAEIWHEMRLLQTETVPAEELNLVKNYILGSILGSIDGPFKIMSRWKSLLLNNRDEHDFANSIHIFKTIDAETIQRLANTYYKQEDFYDLIVY